MYRFKMAYPNWTHNGIPKPGFFWHLNYSMAHQLMISFASCNAGQFLCNNGNCINGEKRCDGDHDCGDDSDEDNCGTCKAREFRCDSGTCIKGTWRCDNGNDCNDYSDEAYCGNRNEVELFKQSGFKGKKLTITKDDRSCCFNLLNSSFNDETSSIRLNGHCMSVFSGLGCQGASIMLNFSMQTGCGSDLEKCNWNKKISSLAFCESSFPAPYENASSSQGQPCIETCNQHGRNYFWCRVSNNSSDYCRRRPGQDYFGNDVNQSCTMVEVLTGNQSHSSKSSSFLNEKCNEGQFECDNGKCVKLEYRCDNDNDCRDKSDEVNCGICLASQFKCDNGKCIKGTWRCDDDNDCSDYSDEAYCGTPNQVELYKDEGFKGKSLIIPSDNRSCCFNFQNSSFDDVTSSIRLNGHCLHIFSGLGCTGTSMMLNTSMQTACASSLEKCNWNDKISSLALCRSRLPAVYDHPSSSQGRECMDSCAQHGKNYFWCHVSNCSSAYCRKRPGQDYFGNNNDQDCSTGEGTCKANQFECDNGDCIKARHRCDKDNDCADYSDEANCGYPKQVELFQHKDFEGQTLAITEDKSLSGRCFNLHRIDGSSFNDITSSIRSNGHCVHVFSGFGCQGMSMKFNRSIQNKCGSKLGKCDWDDQISSLAFCESTLSSAFYSPPGNGPKAAVLYVRSGRQGKNVAVSWANRSLCFNLRYEEESSTNFNKMIHSVDFRSPTSACLLLYNSIGCTGDSISISAWANEVCALNLNECKWEFKASSVSSCDVRFPPISSKPRGSLGGVCNDACETRGKSYFWCELKYGSWDFCSPRPGQNHLGEFCGTNCSKIGTITKDYPRASLYIKEWFEGAHSFIDNMHCVTLGYDPELSTNFNNALMSIAMDNDACLHLYDRIGCTGDYLEVSVQKNASCLYDLETCDLHRKVSSLSFCDAEIPPKYPSPLKGVQGNNCSSVCDDRGRNNVYFWCEVGGSWDFCSPRPEVNYFGDHAMIARTSDGDNNNTDGVILYNQTKFKGKELALSNEKNKRCHNLPQIGLTEDFHKRLASIDLGDNCLQLYEGVGCSGEFLEIVAEDSDNCHADLAACGWNSRVLSIRFCDAPWPEKYSQPKGFRGERCSDDCNLRGKLYFGCHVQSGTYDYCLPRPGQDYFGNDCEGNCWNISNLVPKEKSSSGRMDRLSMRLTWSAINISTLWVYIFGVIVW